MNLSFKFRQRNSFTLQVRWYLIWLIACTVPETENRSFSTPKVHFRDFHLFWIVADCLNFEDASPYKYFERGNISHHQPHAFLTQWHYSRSNLFHSTTNLYTTPVPQAVVPEPLQHYPLGNQGVSLLASCLENSRNLHDISGTRLAFPWSRCYQWFQRRSRYHR